MMKGWPVAEFFIEDGVSGSVPLAERPEGQRLLANVGAGDIIITPKLDRAFRSASDALGTLEALKERRGFAVETLNEPHGGPFAGSHARYVLPAQVTVLKIERQGDRHA